MSINQAPPQLANKNLFQTRPFVDNEFVETTGSGKTFTVTNPATEEVLAELPVQTEG